MGCWCLKKKKKEKALGSGTAQWQRLCYYNEGNYRTLHRATCPGLSSCLPICIEQLHSTKARQWLSKEAEGSPGRNPRQDFKLERKAQSLCQRHTVTLERGKKKGEVKKKERGGEIR